MPNLSPSNRSDSSPLQPHDPGDETQSYLLRLWHTGDGEAKSWRATLQSVRTGERHIFANLEALLVFLVDQTARR